MVDRIKSEGNVEKREANLEGIDVGTLRVGDFLNLNEDLGRFGHTIWLSARITEISMNEEEPGTGSITVKAEIEEVGGKVVPTTQFIRFSNGKLPPHITKVEQ